MHIIDKWIAKLRNDPQDTFIKQSFFENNDRKNCRACALGKLYQLLDDFKPSAYGCAMVAKELGVNINNIIDGYTVYYIITTMNDGGKTGKEIAAFVELNKDKFKA